MYLINRDDNRIAPVTAKSFKELGLREREHLQEWLAHQPDALGEELLILQKEFNGFDGTQERLDLLALDKAGNLVIIENKLDDSGRDVVWQAIKYAAYCSSLTKSQIIDIFEHYLRHNGEEGDARELIQDFLDASDLDEIQLNTGQSQRIIFVAANFRKEVTSTALWLLAQGVTVQCFKITPFELGEQLVLNVEQVIPTPEAEELMISMKAKTAEERSTEGVQKNRHTIRRAFWEQALDALRHSDCRLYDNISPSKEHWLSAGSGVSGCTFMLVFGKKEIRVELNLAQGTDQENKRLFDTLFVSKAQIESSFGADMDWKRLDARKSSRIYYAEPIEGYKQENWTYAIEWMIGHMIRFERAFKEPLHKAAEQLKGTKGA